MVNASDCGSEDRGFESLHSPHFPSWDCPILGCRQVVRHQTLTLAFVGSSPAIPAMSEQGVLCSDFIFFLPDPLAQLAEQLPFKQWVWSSNLQRVTKKFGNLLISELFLLFSAAKNSRFKAAFFRVSNLLVTPTGHQKAAGRLLFCVPVGDSKTCNATVRWTVARATDAGLLASKAFGNLPDCKQHCAPERDSNIFAVQKCKRTQAGHQKAAERLLFFACPMEIRRLAIFK